MRRIERMQPIRSRWREGASMLTHKALGSRRKDSRARTNDPPRSAQSASPPFLMPAGHAPSYPTSHPASECHAALGPITAARRFA
jgi:hypothetical protein